LRERELQRLGERGIVFSQQDAHRRKYTRGPLKRAPAERWTKDGAASLEAYAEDAGCAGRRATRAARNPPKFSPCPWSLGPEC